MGFLRHPHTQQERRENWEYVRPKRRRLPTAWDDFFKPEDRCWKRYRKTQYRVKDRKPKKNSRRYGKAMSRRDHFHYEHRRCSWSRNRCDYCIRHDVWKWHDKEIDKAHKRILEEQRTFTEMYYSREDSLRLVGK